mmetsp:Transcript_25979/g.53150  ORF Transcript_25979/g.53150 Transcript_25979/m.53150 type:complete len:290 (+) Transcript_25979:2383-3252(+)
MPWSHDQFRRLLTPPKPRVHDANGGPHQSLAGSRADAIARRGGLFEELESDASDHAKEVCARRGGIESRRDAQGVDHVGGCVRRGVAQVLGEAHEDPFGLGALERTGEGAVAEAVEGLVEHGSHDIGLHDRLEDLGVERELVVASIAEYFTEGVGVTALDAGADGAVELPGSPLARHLVSAGDARTAIGGAAACLAASALLLFASPVTLAPRKGSVRAEEVNVPLRSGQGAQGPGRVVLAHLNDAGGRDGNLGVLEGRNGLRGGDGGLGGGVFSTIFRAIALSVSPVLA